MKAKAKGLKGLDEILFPEPTSVRTIEHTDGTGGEEVAVPKASWGKEIQVGKAIGRVLAQLKDVREGKTWDVQKLVPQLMENAPDELTKMVAILLDREVSWVETELDAEAVIGIMLPFCMNRVLSLQRFVPEDVRKRLKQLPTTMS